jgi:predicted transcriptional regulator
MTMRNDEWSQIFTDLRKETGLTQKMASEQAGMRAHYVARIECGNYSPRVMTF